MEKTSARWMLWLYGVAVGIALFTGFGNMPLWGRYYIADIPGLGWSRNFYLNLQVHLLIGAVLLSLAVYFLIEHVYARRSGARLSRSGSIRGTLLVLALLSGLVLAVRNLSGVRFPFEFQVGLVFFHMGAAMAFMLASIGCLLARCRWTKDAAPPLSENVKS